MRKLFSDTAIEAMNKKSYGLYRTKHGAKIRNYHRELKNGKGISLIGLINWSLDQESLVWQAFIESKGGKEWKY